MAKTVEMFVFLKIPDLTAITAAKTLNELGISDFTSLSRADYYRFLIEGDVDNFRSKISKVDILVNSNKHNAIFSSIPGIAKIIVKDIENPGEGILKTLKNRLGFNEIKKIEKGTLWIFETVSKDPKKLAEKAAKDLLVNEHFQEYEVL